MSSSTRKPKAEAQFAALGIDPADFTPAMRLAVTQKWTGLPVEEKVDVLRARIAAVIVEEPPALQQIEDQIVAEVEAEGVAPDANTVAELAVTEHARLKRNAGVNAWRERKQLQAALDARDLKFKALRAKRTAPVKNDGDRAMSAVNLLAAGAE